MQWRHHRRDRAHIEVPSTHCRSAKGSSSPSPGRPPSRPRTSCSHSRPHSTVERASLHADSELDDPRSRARTLHTAWALAGGRPIWARGRAENVHPAAAARPYSHHSERAFVWQHGNSHLWCAIGGGIANTKSHLGANVRPSDGPVAVGGPMPAGIVAAMALLQAVLGTGARTRPFSC